MAAPETRVLRLGDELVTVFHIGVLARSLGRATVTLRRWERQGVIPRPILRAGKYRVYLASELATYQRVAEIEGIRSGLAFRLTGFTPRLFAEIAAIRRQYEPGSC